MGVHWQGLAQDLRYSVRRLRRSPAFSLMAVLILGLGIGASTAAFSIVNTVFFRALAVPAPDRLVYMYSVTERGFRYPSLGENYVSAFAGRLDQVFAGVTAHRGRSVTLGADGESSPARGEIVTANYFDVLGVRPSQGRGFQPQEDDPANPLLAVVIADALWARRFQRDPAILGKEIRLNDKVFSVVGVAPPGFDGLSDFWSPSQFWVTNVQFEPELSLAARPWSVMGAIARLKPGVSIAQAQALVSVVGVQLQEDAMRARPARNWRPTPQAVVAAAEIDNPHEPDAWAIAPQLLSAIGVVVAIVLVIAATNIAGVLAARGITRAQEVAVRQALGASAPQLVRQLLTESVVLALAGGAAGLLLARVITGLYQAIWPARFLVDVTFDLRVVLFTIAVCLGAGVLVGLAPALQAGQVNVVSALAAGAGTGGRVKRRLRHAIVIPQVALSVVLLLVAGVHVRTLSGMETADLGYQIDGVVTLRAHHWDVPRPMSDMSQGAREQRGERDRVYARALADRVAEVSSADGVAIAATLPVYGPSSAPGRFMTQTAFLAGNPEPVSADPVYVSPGYFQTMGMQVLEGRDFDARDAMSATAVAVVSESLAARLWPGRSAVGQLLAWYRPEQKDPPWWLTVIGVASETDPVLAPGGDRPVLYTALSQTWQPYSFIVVARHRGDPVPVIEEVKRAVASADVFSEVREIRSLSQTVAELLFPRRAAVGILLACGGVGLLLACIGIYGVISHSVAQRLQEIGIRATLGASRHDILVLVLREAVVVSLAGALPGLALGVLALTFTSNIVGEVPIFDATTFVAVPVAALMVILAASYLPARRASRLDPMAVLRGL